jgi:hypothetical protein
MAAIFTVAKNHIDVSSNNDELMRVARLRFMHDFCEQKISRCQSFLEMSAFGRTL